VALKVLPERLARDADSECAGKALFSDILAAVLVSVPGSHLLPAPSGNGRT